MIKPIAYGTHGHVLRAVSYCFHHGYRHSKRRSAHNAKSTCGTLKTEARQSVHMTGAGAPLASEALSLASMMAWLG